MSPLVTSPNRGYADWQRVDNYDSGIEWTVSAGPTQATTTSPVMDMSRYGYVGGEMLNSQNSCLVQFQWFADAAGTLPIGVRFIVLSANVANPAQLRLPNLGPFLQITVTPLNAVNYFFSTRLIGTNRYHPLEFIPQNPVIVDSSNIALAGGGVVSLYPSDYYAGPVSISVFCPQAVNTRIVWLSTTGVWDTVQENLLTANVQSNFTMMAPSGAWRLDIANTTGTATTAYARVVPSLTGSS